MIKAIVAGVAVMQLVSMAPAGAVTAGRAPRATSSDEIAFVNTVDDNWELLALDPATRAVRRLTRTPGDESGPAWSPDRSRIAYFVSRDDVFSKPAELWTMNADGSDATMLHGGLEGVFATINWDDSASPHIAWALDGNSLAFSIHHLKSKENPFSEICGEIWTIRADGSDARRLLADQPLVTSFDWSSDGQRIVYGLDRTHSCDGGDGLWSMNADGSDQHSLQAPKGRSPSWSPDGESIVFDDWRNTCHRCGEIWLMGADGSDQRALVLDKGSSWSRAPSWSPDGSRIVFEQVLVAGGSQLWTIRPDGSGAAKLLDGGWEPSW